MSEQPQHPDRAGDALAFIIELAKLAPIAEVAKRVITPGPMPTTDYQAFEKLQHELHVMAVYWNTGKEPVIKTVKSADNGRPAKAEEVPPESKG